MNPHEQEGQAPAGKQRKKFPKKLFIPVVMMGMGYLIGGFFVKASPKASTEPKVEEHQPDPTIDDTIGEQRWKDATVKIRSDLRTADGPQQIPLKFREGICQERLGEYAAAAQAYAEVIAAEPSSVRGTAARISHARCQIKLNRLADARGTLARLMLLSGDEGRTGSPLHADLLATIAHVEYLSANKPNSPHPLSPNQPATTEKIPDLEQLITWAGPLPKPKPKKHGASHGDDAHGHGADDHGHAAAPADDHKPADDHGHGEKPAPVDEHGKKPAASKTDHPEDDHGKKPAAPKADHPADDHGKKPAAPKADHPADVHGKKPAAPKADHPEDDHGKKPAAPKADHPEDDHGKKPATPKADHPADDHAKKPAAPKADHPEDDHGKKPAAPKPAAPKPEHGDIDHKNSSQIAFIDNLEEDHGKKPAAKEEDHGKKPAVKEEDHGKKPAVKEVDHGKKPAAKAEPADDHAPKPEPKKAGPARETAAKPRKDIRISADSKPGEWLVSVDIQSRGLRSVVETMARELGLSLRLTGIAEELLSGKAANILVTDLPATQVLDSLLHPAELEWKIADLELVVSPLDNSDAAWSERTRRAIERSLASEYEHSWRIGLMIDLGNLEFLARNWRAAFDIYTRSLDEGGLRPEAVAANYNMGMTCVRLNLRDRAREQFQNLVDRDASGKWGPLAYWWAGRSHLDVDEPEKAIKYFEAALDTTETGPSVTAAALGLSFCHLMKNDYPAALAAIRPYRDGLKISDFKQTSAFVDALCRFKQAENPRVTGEADEILYAVLNVTEDLAVGPAGAYQLGKMCRELGFGPRMVVLYTRTLEDLRGGLAVRMTRELADYHYSDGDPVMAVEGYKAVAAVNREEPGRHAWLQLARLAIRDKKTDDAGRYCLEAMRIGADRDAILKELGKVYELKKDFKKAAKCFAGEFP